MLEFLGGSVVYSILKDIWSAIRGRRRRLTPERVLELRQKWKKEIEPILWKRTRDKLGLDVIIRDVKRLDHYPDNTDANRHGISAWFKAGLSSTYHNGIEVNRGWYGLVQDANGWRLQKLHGEEGSKTVALILTIPYERIEHIDWSGDTFYGNSQVYCHFDAKDGTPYEDAFYATQEQNPGGPFFYLKVATQEEVRRNSEKAGTWWKRKPRPLLERLGLRSKSEEES
jgi:hypothetical protein